MLFSFDEDLIGEDGGSLGVSSGGSGMEEELCVRRVSLHSLLSAPGVYVSLGGGLCFFLAFCLGHVYVSLFIFLSCSDLF